MENRRPALYGALFFSLFIIYGSLYPFHWQARPGALPWADLLAILLTAETESSRLDFSTNVLLTVPLAFCLMIFLRAKTRLGAPVLSLAVLVFCLLLAIAVEVLQLYVPGRVPSKFDVIAQGLGAVIGIALWAWRGEALWRLLFDWSPFNQGQSRWEKLASLYLIGVFSYGLLPLDLTLSPHDLLAKWKLGRIHILPFHALAGPTAVLLYQYLSIVLIWAVAAWLMSKAKALSTTSEIVGRTVLAAALLELLQLFVMSRNTDSTDVLLAAVAGLGVGLLRSSRAKPLPDHAPPGTLGKGQLALLIAAWSLLTMALAWYPYQPRADWSTLLAELAQWRAAPLGLFFEAGPLHAATSVLQKSLLFAPWGVLAAWVYPREPRASGRSKLASRAVLFCGLGLMLIIEGGKLLLDGKNSNPSNIAFELFAVWLAYRWVKLLRRRHRPAPLPASSSGSGRPTGPVSTAITWPWLALPQALLLCAAFATLGQLAGLPYSLRALFAAESVWRLICLSLAFSVAILPWAWWANLPPNRRPLAHLLLLGAVQPLLLYTLLRIGAPEKLVFDIIGTPHTALPREIEAGLRFAALNLLLAWGMLSAHRWLDAKLTQRSVTHGLLWLLASLAVALVWHWVVVNAAVTDNLIELMRGEGSALTTACIFAWWALLYGGALQTGRVLLGLRRPTQLLTVALSALLAYWLLDAALEPILVKYGRVFSAWQFLLSQDRANYAASETLPLRYAVAHAISMLGLMWLILPVLLNERRQPRRAAAQPSRPHRKKA